MLSRTLTITAVCVAAMQSGVARADANSNWPGWRGPLQNGHSIESGFPTQWDDSQLVFKTSLPGDGQSSPVTWGDRIFLTTALNGGQERAVLCVDRTTGDILWQTSVWKGEPEETHKMNGHASSTCTTDGERVYAFFGHGGGLVCLTVDGRIVWEKPLGKLPGPWGTAACPRLVDNLVIQNCDCEGQPEESFLIAVDRLTGETVWKTPREPNRGWSSPVLIEAGGRRELVLQGDTGVRSYDPATGRELWFVTGSAGRGTPTVTPGNGLLYVVPGRPGMTYAIRPGGSGDIAGSNIAWQVERKGRDLPSPAIIDKFMLVMSHKGGILTCYNADSGEELWARRIGGMFSASPVVFDGKAAFIAEDGTTLVIDPHAADPIVATNNLTCADDEIFRASITPSGGQLLIRSTKVLYCVRGKQ